MVVNTPAMPLQEMERLVRGGELTHIALCCRAGIGPNASKLTNTYFSVVLEGVEAECRRRGLHLIYTLLEDDANQLAGARETLNKSGVGALLLVNFTNQDLVAGLLELGLPTVLVDHYFPDLPLDVVMNENYAGSVRAVTYLIQMGHRKIGFLDGLEHYTIQRRREGYRAALEAAGIAFDPRRMLPGDLQVSGGVRAADEILARKLDCTAYFCANDNAAIGLMKGLQSHGIRVPEDVSVVGFDDIDLAHLITPGLTTVQANVDQVGRMGVFRLLERVKDPNLPVTQTLIYSRLVERQSAKRV